MKSIRLYTATADNSGRRCEAGAKIAVGDKSNQISEAAAKDLVSSHRAAGVTAARSTTRHKPKRKAGQHSVSQK